MRGTEYKNYWFGSSKMTIDMYNAHIHSIYQTLTHLFRILLSDECQYFIRKQGKVPLVDQWLRFYEYIQRQATY